MAARAESYETIQRRFWAHNAALCVPPAQLLEDVRRAHAVEMAKGEAARIRAAKLAGAAAEQLLDRFASNCADVSSLVATAMELDRERPFGRRFWELASTSLILQIENLVSVCKPFRDLRSRLRRSQAADHAWPERFEARYDAVLERAEDLSETIGLSLSEEFRKELGRRMAEVEAAD
jgi:hypothetical protein